MVWMLEKLQAIEKKREKRNLKDVLAAVERQHEEGKLTARERINKLLDPGTFYELDPWINAYKTGFDIDGLEIPGDSVVVGWGEINGRPVYVWAQDATVLGGTVAEIHVAKIVRVMEKALTERIPIIGIYDSEGLRIPNESVAHSYCTYSKMMRFQTWSSGVIPQIALVMGPCTGGLALSAALADFILMVKNTGFMHVAPLPAGVDREEYGGAQMHAEISGCCDILAADDEDCLQKCKELLSFLPQNNTQKPPLVDTGDGPERADEELMNIVPSNSAWTYDMREIISLVADNKYYFEVKENYAPNISTGFVRFKGQPAGIIANNPNWIAGVEDTKSSDKHARFTRFCDAFNLPLIYFADCPGFIPSVEQERLGILRHGTMVIHSTSEATVPKISIFVRKTYGGAQLVMPSNWVKADRQLAWPSVERGLMGAESLAAVMFKGRLDRAKSPEERDKIWQDAVREMQEAVNRFSEVANEDYIDPRQTRSAIIKSLKFLSNKTVERAPRKHENINL